VSEFIAVLQRAASDRPQARLAFNMLRAGYQPSASEWDVLEALVSGDPRAGEMRRLALALIAYRCLPRAQKRKGRIEATVANLAERFDLHRLQVERYVILQKDRRICVIAKELSENVSDYAAHGVGKD
jgi:hypothetical protein